MKPSLLENHGITIIHFTCWQKSFRHLKIPWIDANLLLSLIQLNQKVIPYNIRMSYIKVLDDNIKLNEKRREVNTHHVKLRKAKKNWKIEHWKLNRYWLVQIQHSNAKTMCETCSKLKICSKIRLTSLWCFYC